MSFGFPAFHESQLALPFPVDDQWIAHTARCLGWTYGGRSPDPRFGCVWIVTVGITMWSWGATLRLWPLGPQQLGLRSACDFPLQCIDWGDNRRNVEKFGNALHQQMVAAMQGQQ